MTDPKTLGKYEIQSVLGKGAMGVVYLAKDPLIGRLVALKTFRIGYSVKDRELEQFRARFRREAQSAGILSHPNIVTIHDVVDSSDEGATFIAMEYVRGTNLKILLQRDVPLDLPFVAGVIDQVADALDYAHSRGVVHRDVKPANIIIMADNRVKITDFGIARLDTSNLTQEGQLLGTPNYMSPEQILGKEVDHRADIFSLGVVLYEMLTRHKPFQGENLTVVSHRIVYDHFTPPAEFVRDLPPGVEAILVRALDKDPARRYQKARELAEDLGRLVATRVAGEALNETQNLSSTLVGTPSAPPAVPAAPTASRRGWFRRAPRPAASAPAAVPGAAVAVADATPVPSPRPFPDPSTLSDTTPLGAFVPAIPPPPVTAAAAAEPSWPRLATVAWVTAAAVVLAATLAWFAVDWQQPGGRDEVVQAGPPPLPPGARRQLEKVSADAAARQRQVADMLARAHQALAGRQYELAAATARGVLVLDSTNGDAQSILAAVPAPHEAPVAAPAPKPPRRVAPVREPRPAPPPVAPASVPAPPAPVATDAKLAVHLFTEMPAGTLMVYLGEKQLMHEPFAFFKKKGLFLREPSRGTVDDSFTIPAGTAKLRVYVTPNGQAARVLELSGNFPGGAQRQLNIQLDRDGKLTAGLE